jgi:hypothetical protein
VRKLLMQDVDGMGRFAPIRIAKDVLGNKRALRVSPQHRMLLTRAKAELLFGTRDVLVAAKHLTRLPGVKVAPVESVTYIHLVLDAHEIVFANGAPSESFFPGDAIVESGGAIWREIAAIFPDASQLRPARPLLRQSDCRALLAA